MTPYITTHVVYVNGWYIPEEAWPNIQDCRNLFLYIVWELKNYWMLGYVMHSDQIHVLLCLKM